MIPVIGIPVLNRGDMLLRCVKSIGYPYEKLVVVNNGRHPSVTRALTTIKRKLKDRLTVVENGKNMGVAASWNYIIREFPAEFHLICASDIQFERGDVEFMHREYELEKSAPLLVGNHGFSFFIITRLCINEFGTFDENFHPAYMEDCDYMWRIRCMGKDHRIIPCASTHGEAPHWGSTTIYSHSDLRDRNHVTFEKNAEYYVRKWGGRDGSEVYKRPFNDPNWPVNRWLLEKDRLEELKIW